MAGTLYGLSLSQRVDLNGLPSVAWRLYLYTANTSTPVNSYQDTALSVLNAWPLTADSSGMLPQFWLADGSYRARATNADGSLTYFDQPSILALGASAGAAPSGGVDANAIFATGDVLWLDKSGAKTGWVRDNGRSIGSATSGADERANTDCQPLFEYLWNNFSDTLCPVVTGRGGSSLADWTANKKITLPDKRGYIPGGLDDMGNTAAGRYSGVPIVLGGVTTAGAILGEATHVTTSGEMPSHTHTGSGTTDGQSADHTHIEQTSVAGGASTKPPQGLAVGTLQSGNTPTLGTSNDHTHTFSFTTAASGSGSAHNNVQKTVLGTFYRKL